MVNILKTLLIIYTPSWICFYFIFIWYL